MNNLFIVTSVFTLFNNFALSKIGKMNKRIDIHGRRRCPCYKQGTLHMVKALTLSDQMPLNPANKINNYIQ